jgi:hypothetical protein
LMRPCGRSSEVERQLPKLNVVGSIPIARSRTDGRRMSVVAEERGLEARRSNRRALIVTAAAVLCLVGAGLLLWSRHGASVFGDTVLAALAWCF